MKRVAARPENAHQARMLGMLRDNGPLSRAELGDATGLSRTKIAIEVGRLVELGLVEDAGPAVSRGGRRSTMARLALDLRFLGIDIGATSVDVALTDGELRVLDHVSQPCDVRVGPRAVHRHVVVVLPPNCGPARRPEICSAPASAYPGPVSFRDGAPVVPPLMPGWHHVPVRDLLSQELGCPVLVDNDVNIMAMGERQAGVARGAEDFLFIKLGTGIGCGVFSAAGCTVASAAVPATSATSGSTTTGLRARAATAGCLEAFFGGAALARDATAAAKEHRSAILAERLAAGMS